MSDYAYAIVATTLYMIMHVYLLIDDTRHNVAIPEYAHSGILETINLSWGAFFVQVYILQD